MKVGAVVLAAGSGKRMGGTGKALLEEDGVPFLERVIRSSREGGCEVVWVVLRESQPEAEKRARSWGGVPVRNEDPERGMFSSVQAGLQKALGSSDPPGGFLLFPVDHPRVRIETLKALVRAFPGKPEGTFLQPVHEGRGGHPIGISSSDGRVLLAFEPRETLKQALARAGLTPHAVPVADPGIRENLNTPSDF